jgi:hypothetical protein
MLGLYCWCRNEIVGGDPEEKRRRKLAREKYSDIITCLNV